MKKQELEKQIAYANERELYAQREAMTIVSNVLDQLNGTDCWVGYDNVIWYLQDAIKELQTAKEAELKSKIYNEMLGTNVRNFKVGE